MDLDITITGLQIDNRTPRHVAALKIYSRGQCYPRFYFFGIRLLSDLIVLQIEKHRAGGEDKLVLSLSSQVSNIISAPTQINGFYKSPYL